MDSAPPPPPIPPPPPFSPGVPPPRLPPRPKGWWGRNWLWFIPTGCLTLLVVGAAIILLIVTFVFGAMKSTDIYKDALGKAQRDPQVTAALGEPVRDGSFFTGSTSTNGPAGDANLTVPIHGPKGKGTLSVVAKKSDGEWTYQTLAVEVAETGKRIDLLSGTERQGVAPEEEEKSDSDEDDDDSAN